MKCGVLSKGCEENGGQFAPKKIRKDKKVVSFSNLKKIKFK